MKGDCNRVTSDGSPKGTFRMTGRNLICCDSNKTEKHEEILVLILHILYSLGSGALL